MSRVVNRLANMNKTTRSSVFTYALVVGAFVILQLIRMTTGLGSVLEGQLIPISRNFYKQSKNAYYHHRLK